MKTFRGVLPDHNNQKLDTLLDAQGTGVIVSLELIDALITRAIQRGVEIQFERPDGRLISLDLAYRLRWESGMDIRWSIKEYQAGDAQ